MVLILNDVSGSEIILVLIFILMFFGAKSIPGLARTLGRTIRQVKDASNEIQSEIRKSGKDMKKDLNIKGILEETAEDIKRPLDQYANDLDDAIKYQPPNKHSHIPPTQKKEESEDKKEVPEEKTSETQDHISEKSEEEKKG